MANIAPIHNLSDDVLGDIFLRCIFLYQHADRFGHSTSTNTFQRKNPPWTISQTCSRWRHLSLSMPQIWATIIVDSKAVEESSSPEFIDLTLKLMLQRSGAQALSVSLTGNLDSANGPLIQLWSNILFALKTQCRRWKSFRIFLGYSETNITGFLRNVEGHLDSLEDVVYLAREQELCGLFTGCSSLKRLHMQYTLPSLPDSPWPQLTHLTLSDISFRRWNPKDPYSVLLKLIHKMPSLFYLDIRCSFITRTPVAHIPITCPHLHEMRLGSSATLLTGYINTPALEAIHLSDLDESSVQTTIEMFRRSGCSSRLRWLKMEFYDCALAPVFLSLLEQVPSLLSLIIREMKDHSNVVLSILNHLVLSPLLPNLTEVVIRSIDHDDDTIKKYRDALVRLARSRWRSRRSLQLHPEAWRPLSSIVLANGKTNLTVEDIDEEIRDMVMDGLRFEIRGKSRRSLYWAA